MPRSFSTYRAALIAGAFMFLPHASSAADQSEEIAALKAQLKMMSDRLAALEAADGKPAAGQATANVKPANSQLIQAPDAYQVHIESASGNNDARTLSGLAPAATTPTSAASQTTAVTAPSAGPGTKSAATKDLPVSPQVATGVPRSTVPGEGEPVVGGSFPGSFKIPGTQTSFKIGGYAKLDAIYDAGHAYGAQFANFANIPLKNSALSDFNDSFNMHARQTRLNIETHTPTDLGDFKVFVEADFFGAAAGNRRTLSGEGIQLRHAYGSVGPILAGQFWSNFTDIDAYPESLDFVGPVGINFIRQAQVRYTHESGSMTYAFAVESPQPDFTSPVTTNINLEDTPDLTGRVQYKGSFGHVALRGLARHLQAGNSLTRQADGEYGWGVGVSGKLLTWGKDSLSFEGSYGDGIGRYIFDVANSGNGTTYVNGTIDPQTAYGGYVAYQHFWSDDWRSNFMLGYAGIENDTSRTGLDVNKEIASAHTNLIWSPFPSYRVGVEYMHGYRKQESGIDGELNRFQASFMYLF